jgi:hypothetical protein
LNASFADKDLIEEPIEQVYTLDENHLSGCGWGCDMAKFEVKLKWIFGLCMNVRKNIVNLVQDYLMANNFLLFF